MASQPFGRHLHNQIVIPLLAGCVFVAFAATVVAVFQLQGLIGNWVGGDAEQAVSAAKGEFRQVAERLRGEGRLLVHDEGLEVALRREDWTSVRRTFDRARASAEIDDLMLLDSSGKALVVSGECEVQPGDMPLGAAFDYPPAGGDRAEIVRFGDEDALTAVVRRSTQGPGPARDYILLVTRCIDREMLASNFSMAPAVGYCDPKGRLRASFVNRASALSKSAGIPVGGVKQYAAEFESSISAENPSLTQALSTLDRPSSFASGGEQFTVRAAAIDLGPEVRQLAGPAVQAAPKPHQGYVFVVMSNAVAAEAGRTTIGLVALWSALAALVLTGLGVVVARKVSAPLAELSEGARRVADGDFTTRVDVRGANEVGELAESFNAMTASLNDRSEALTKKVLELATLYEMSGALGSTLDMDVLFDSVLDSAIRIFNIDSGYVMLRDKSGGMLELRALHGITMKPDDRAVRSSMSEWVVRHGRPLIFEPSKEKDPDEQVDTVTGALAALCVPLVSNDGVIGAICVGSRDRNYRFLSDDVRLLSTIANHMTIAIGNIELFSSLQEAYLATVRSLAAAVDAKDPHTRGHSDRVAFHAKSIAERLQLSSEQSTALEMAAYLHDIGKIGVRESILLRAGPLDPGEMTQMRHHPLIGANILRPVAFPWPIAPIVRHHHERYDGEGYPAGLKGEEIPLLARILAVADAFEAMTADRPYRSGRSAEDAVDELKRCSGTQFDPRLVDTFLKALAPVGAPPALRAAQLLEDVQPEEVRALCVAICDGMFSSFRRLGGPRLGTNVEASVNEFFAKNGMPFSLRNGHLAAEWDESELESQVESMREVLETVSSSMEEVAGGSLVDHFYDEAIAALSERMRGLATALDLYRHS